MDSFRQLDFILFFGGLAFILLASLCQFLNRRGSRQLAWHWLGLFALLYGAQEWMNLLEFSLDWGSNPALSLIRTIMPAFALVALVEFGRGSMAASHRQVPGTWILAALVGVSLLGGFAGLPGFLASSRYVLGLSGGFWASAAFYLASREQNQGKAVFLGAAVGMALFALAASLLVSPAPFFPASWLNAETVGRALGFPIDLMQALAGVGLCACLYLFGRTILAEETDQRVRRWENNLLRGTVFGLIILVIGGWFFCQYLGRYALLDLRIKQDYHGKMLIRSLESKLTNIDNLVGSMAQSPAITSWVVTKNPQNVQQVDSILDRYSHISAGSIWYLINDKGLTIASSNRKLPDSFVGKNFGVRPYFQEAMHGPSGRYWALGVVSKEFGYYSSSPVKDDKGNTRAVTVIKQVLNGYVELMSQDLSLVIDPRGIVILSNNPEMQLKSLWPLSDKVREELITSQQFGKGPFPAILDQDPLSGTECQLGEKRLIIDRQPFLDNDLVLITLTSIRPITMARLVGIGICLSLGLVLMGLTAIIGLNISAAARIQRSEKQYRDLYENMQDGSMAVNSEGKIVDYNLALQNMLGYSPEEFGQLTSQEVTPERWHPLEAKIVEEQVSIRGYSDQYEKELRRKDGSIFPVELQTYLIKDEEGNYAGLWSLIRDITKRKQTLETLKESEEKYRVVIESIPSVVFKGYAGGYVDFFNNKIQDITGYPMEDFNTRKMKWLDIMVPEDAAQVTEAYKEAVASGQKVYMREYRIITKAGAIIWIQSREHIFYNEHGEVDFISGTFTDITQQHEMQAVIEQIQRHNELILSSLGDGLFELNQAGEVVFVNPAAGRLVGYQPKDMMGQNLHYLIHHKKADGSPYPEEDCPIYATLRDGQERKVTDDVFWTERGVPLPVAYLTTPIIENDQVVGLVGSFRDITWRKQAETELRSSRQFLENVIENSAESIGLVDSHGHITKWNKVSEVLYGYSFKELEGKMAFDLYANKDEMAKMMIPLRRDGSVKDYEITMKRKDGSTFPASLSIKVMRDAAGKNMGSVTVARDLTELKEREAKWRGVNEKLQALVIESTQLNRQMSLLQEMSDVFHACLTSGETYGAIAQFAPKFFPEYAGAVYLLNNSKNLFEMTASWGEASSQEVVFGHSECWALRRSRTFLVSDAKSALNCRHVTASLPGSYLCLPLMAQGEALGILHLQKTSTEEPDQIKAIGQFATTVAEAMALALANLKLRETLRNQAIRDGLTGLFNRRYLEETLERELSRSQRLGNPLGVVMLDLDHFKEYNDKFGHNGGDELLVALGQLIQECMRKEDIACRYGGEEFLLIMPGAQLETVLERAQNLVQGVRQLHLQSRSLRPITISAGVAIFPDHGSSGKEVIGEADAALYQAKTAGRDRVVVAGSVTKRLMKAK